MFAPGSGTRDNVRKFVILVTDGGSNNKTAAQKQSSALKNAGIHIIVIGTGNWLDLNEIYMIASHPNIINSVIVSNYTNLVSITGNIVNMICKNLPACASGPCLNSGTCVEDVLSYTCQNCASGFAGRNCDVQCRIGADVIFAVGVSSSLSADNFQLQLDFVRQLILGLNVNGDSRVGMLVYSDQASVVFNLNSYTSLLDMLNAVSTSLIGGKTNIGNAIILARDSMFTTTLGDRSNYPNILVLVTNSHSANITGTVTEAMAARNQNISILVVTVNGFLSQSELQGLASFPVSSNIFNVTNFTQLTSITTRVGQSLCNNVNECASSPCLNGGSCADLINGYTCVCTLNYTGTNCQRSGSGYMDIAFAIDTSGSMRNERFPFIINFIASMIDDMEISATKTRVGVVQYSATSQRVFALNTYTNKQDVSWVIKNILFTGGQTNTESALTMLKDVIFAQTSGDRSDAPNFAYVITDGNSNVNQTFTAPAAVLLRSTSTYIVTLSACTDVNVYELYAIASDPTNETVFVVPSYNNLTTIYRDTLLLAIARSVDRCTPNPCTNGGICYNDVKRYVCRCPTVWAGLTCTNQCTKLIDLAVVLDLSGSGSFAEVWSVNIAFVKHLINNLPTTPNQVRVSVVTFGDGANVSFYLNACNSSDSVRNALSFRLSLGQGRLEDAIRYVYTDVLASGSGHGARDTSVPKIAVIITDSVSPSSYSSVLSQAILAKQQGVEIYAVTFGTGPDVNEFQALVSTPVARHLILLTDPGSVPATALTVVTTLCNTGP